MKQKIIVPIISQIKKPKKLFDKVYSVISGMVLVKLAHLLVDKRKAAGHDYMQVYRDLCPSTTNKPTISFISRTVFDLARKVKPIIRSCKSLSNEGALELHDCVTAHICSTNQLSSCM